MRNLKISWGSGKISNGEVGVIFAITLALAFIVVSYSRVKGRASEITDGVAWGPTDGPYIEMDVSAYCICRKCCGRFSDGITASGVPAVGLICAAPPEYAYGTIMVVDGVEWTVEDRGGAIVGNKLDLLMESHEAALNFGRKTIMVEVRERK